MKKFNTLILASLCLFFANNAVAQNLQTRVEAQPIPTKTTVRATTPIDVLRAAPDDETSALPENAVILWGGPGDPNSEFDGGLNDWTTEGFIPGTDTPEPLSLWTWEADADIDEGSFATADPIASPSAGNGAMAFNSDFYDNNGEGAGNIGMGTLPGPHFSHLISPTIDLSNNTEVALNFYTYHRNFQTTVSVSYSNDDGATWSENILVHSEEESPTNAGAINREALIYLPGAGGTDQFKVRFTWDGNYYFWMIDDVSIIESPRHDLEISSFFYTPASYEQPEAHIKNDEFGFFMYVTNAGTEPQTNVVLGAQVRDEDLAILYETEVTIPEIAVGVVDSLYDIEGSYIPDMLDLGAYFLTYTIEADSADQWTADNSDGDQFLVSDLRFSKDHIDTNYESFNNTGNPWQIGAFYQTAGGFDQDYYVGESITFSSFTNAGDPLEGKTITVFLIEISDDVDDGFANLAPEKYIENDDMTIVGVGSFTFTNEEGGDRVTADLSSIDGFDEIVLEENKRYLALLDYADAPTVFTGFNNRINFRDRINFYGRNDADADWFSGFTDGEFMQPIVQLNIGLVVVGTEDQQLAESTLNVQPNPTSDLLTVNIDLEAASKAVLTVTDITGKVMEVQEFDAVDTQSINMNVGNYANGTYLVRLATEAGARTVKVLVQH